MCLLCPGGEGWSQADEAAAARQAYNEKVEKKYNDRFGRENPFLPSNATTDTGEFLDPKSFPTAEYCGHCHQEAHQQWRQSAHSNANRVPWYLKNVESAECRRRALSFRGTARAATIRLRWSSGALTQGAPKKRPYDQDGVTCTVCHSIQKVDPRGHGQLCDGRAGGAGG